MGSVSPSWQAPGDIFPALPYLPPSPLRGIAQYYIVPSRAMGSSEEGSLKDSAFKRPALLSSPRPSGHGILPQDGLHLLSGAI